MPFASILSASLESVLCRWRVTNVPVPEAHLSAVLGALAMDFAEGRSFRAERLAQRIAGAAMATMGITLAGWAVKAAKQIDMARPGRLVTGATRPTRLGGGSDEQAKRPEKEEQMSEQHEVVQPVRRPAGEDARERLLAGTPVTGRRIELSGVSTAVLEGGNGPPVVLLHGQGGFAAQWMPVIPGLVTTHHVIAPDLPGLGVSVVPDGPPDSDLVVS